MNAYMTRRIVVKKLVTLGEGNDQKPLTLFMDDPSYKQISSFLLRQLWIVNYCVKSSSKNLSNDNINTGVAREMLFQE